jgi:hypothetical protein
MHLPARITEHPVESLIAVALLLALLFGSAESGQSPAAAQATTQHCPRVAVEKM